MRSKLEEFIEQHRNDFDSEKMKGGWENIEKRMQHPSKGAILIKRLSWITAAAVVLSFVLTLFTG